MKQSSGAASQSGSHYVMQIVAPKRAALAEANRKLSDANKKLESIRARVKELNGRVASLEDSLMKVGQCRTHYSMLQQISTVLDFKEPSD